MTRPNIRIVANTVRKVCQLTGEIDRERSTPLQAHLAINSTECRFNLYGTDLGSSFEHDGKLWFLFGDTWPVGQTRTGSDSVAWTTAIDPEGPTPNGFGVPLEFANLLGFYQSPVLADMDGSLLDVGNFNVPIAGISIDDQMYILYSTDSFQEIGVAGGLDIFWVGGDNRIDATWANPAVDEAKWRPLVALSEPQSSHSPVAALVRFGDAADVFWIGMDGAIATAWTNPTVNSGSWQPAFAITPNNAARPNSPIAAVTRFSGALDVFWIGPDSAIGSTWSNPDIDQGNWHRPFPITPPGAARVDSPIVAVTRLDGALDIFWIGADGAIATAWANPMVDNGRWQTPFPITPPAAARPGSALAAVTRFAGALDVFWIGGDGALATTWANPNVDGANWHSAFPITAPNASRMDAPLVALSRFNGALDVFWIGADGAIATVWANPDVSNGQWQSPFPITGPGVADDNSSLSAVTRFSGALDVFWIGVDQRVATAWANPDIESGVWQAAFPITGAGSAARGAHIAAISRNNGLPGRTLMGRTVFATARNNDPTDLHRLFDLSILKEGGKFINVAWDVEPNGAAGLPFAGPAILAWGTGRYRDSNVYLACVPQDSIEDLSTWRFLQSASPDTEPPQWGPDQRASTALFDQPQIGELSVTRLEPFGLWLMTYNAPAPRGINARVARSPWGPWSDPVVIFNPGWPGLGYGHFMHDPTGIDGLSDPGRTDEPGGEYGPYLIDRYTRELPTPANGSRQLQIYFVMSTWNPYNTVLMTLAIEQTSDTP